MYNRGIQHTTLLKGFTMSSFSKFDTQIHCEEVKSYQPTQADLAELNGWLEEIEGESGWEELESDDGHRELYEEEEEFQLSAPENWDSWEDSLGELSTLEDFEDDYEPQDDYYDYADLMEY